MMRKKIKKKFKQRVLNLTNALMVVSSILVGYSAVTLSDASQNLKFRESNISTLTTSASRIAVAFEQYNGKRFRP